MIDAKGVLAQGIKAFTMKPLTQAEIFQLIRKVLDGDDDLGPQAASAV